MVNHVVSSHKLRILVTLYQIISQPAGVGVRISPCLPRATSMS